jgi:hypothetical protein
MGFTATSIDTKLYHEPETKTKKIRVRALMFIYQGLPLQFRLFCLKTDFIQRERVKSIAIHLHPTRL